MQEGVATADIMVAFWEAEKKATRLKIEGTQN